MHRLIFILVSLATASAFVVTWNDDPDLPIQDIEFGHLVRRWSDGMEVIECPKGTHLSQEDDDCVFNEAQEVLMEMTILKSTCENLNATSPNDLYPYPEDCRYYINCRDSVSVKMECNLELLFNPETRECDYPRTSGCCEYCGLDPSRLVQSDS